jgi:pyruvate/2-oxoglutarate dehydrogenase complex dihydrolipoamide dehydrogenase (E3) component
VKTYKAFQGKKKEGYVIQKTKGYLLMRRKAIEHEHGKIIKTKARRMNETKKKKIKQLMKQGVRVIWFKADDEDNESIAKHRRLSRQTYRGHRLLFCEGD